jgi:hypothetical protein
MGSIDILIAKYSSWDDCPDRCIFVSHYQILHTGGLRSEDMSLALQPKCILHIASWMCLWNIDSIEVEILCRHLHRVIDIESHPYECILYFTLYECDRMKTSFLSQKRNGHIFLFICEPLLDEIFFDSDTFRLECVCDDVASLICCFSYSTTFFRSEILESLEYCSELARLAKDGIAIFDESHFTCDSRKICKDLCLECLDLFYHILDLERHDKVTVALFGFSCSNSLDYNRGEWIFVLEADIVITDHRECLEKVLTINSDDILLSFHRA